MIQNPYQQYVKQSINTLSPVQTVIALYDKAEQEINKAVYYIDNKDVEKANKSIIKVQDIVNALDGSLERKYNISDNLSSLYGFFRVQLLEANTTKDKDKLLALLPFFNDLKDAFTQISRKV